MTSHRLKCSIDPEQVNERLSQHPEIIELHLNEGDVFGENYKKLIQTIEKLQRLNITVYLHHPIKYQGVFTDILHENEEIREYYLLSTRILHRICLTYQIKCVLHCYSKDSYCANYQDEKHTLELRVAIENILSWGGDVFLWENVIFGLFTFHNPYLFDHVIQPLQLPLTHDISHTFIGVKGNNQKLQEISKRIHPYVKYLHVVDSLGQDHDGLELGTGKIEWRPLLPYLKNKLYIYEVLLENQVDSTPMIRSAEYIENLIEREDKK